MLASELPSLKDLEAALRPPPRRPPPAIERAIRQESLRALVRKKMRLECEGLRLYTPLPMGQQFHQCNKFARVADGSNRSSKTMTVCTEMCRAVTGCDPFDKYLKTNGSAWVIGLDSDHLAMLWAKCAQPGAFKIIQDEHTRRWRSVRADADNPSLLDAYDLAYQEKWRDAPPLIPPRMVRALAWEDRGKGVPRQVKLTTGWKILFRSSEGKPPQGDHIQLAVFDEEMSNLNFYYEAVRGLTALGEPPRHLPKLIWSATSQVANIELATLRERAEAGSEEVGLFRFLVDDNPYVSPEAKRRFFESLPEDERQTRYFGVPAGNLRRIYPMYDPMTDVEQGGHGREPFEIDPRQFCRWVIIDPSIRHCAILFVAIDRDEQYMTVYDGIDINQATPRMAAEEIKAREHGVQFEGCVFDQCMGKESILVAHKPTVAQEFWKEMVAAGVHFRQNGALCGFFPGSNNVEARTQALRRMMEPRRDGPFAGTAKLRVMRGRVPLLDQQIRMAQTDPKNPEKRLKEKKRPQDFLDDLEYAAGFDPGYFEPAEVQAKETPMLLQIFQRRQKQKQAVERRRQARHLLTSR